MIALTDSRIRAMRSADSRVRRASVTVIPDDDRRRTAAGHAGERTRRVTLSDSGAAADSDLPDSAREPLTSEQIAELAVLWKSTKDMESRKELFAQLMRGMTIANAGEMRQLLVAGLSPSSEAFKEFHRVWGSIAGAEAVIKGTETPVPDMAVTLEGWATADPKSALEWYDRLSDESGDFSQRHLAMGMAAGLANADPHLASEFVLGLVEGGISDLQASKMIELVARGMWMKSDSDSAQGVLAWVETLPAGNLRGAANAAIASRYAAHDPVSAAEWAQALQDNRGGAINAVAREWGRRDGAAAVDWLHGLSADERSRGAFYAAFEGWTRSDPAAVREYIDGMQVSQLKDTALRGYAQRTAYKNGPSAVQWASRINDGSARHHTMRETFRRWTTHNPTAAGEYLVEMEPSLNRDHAISGFTDELTEKNSRLALQWAGAVQHDALRETTLMRTGYEVFRKNPRGLEEWLPTSGLPQATQQKMLDRAKR
jgi:hypothetical protein